VPDGFTYSIKPASPAPALLIYFGVRLKMNAGCFFAIELARGIFFAVFCSWV
jgi:hypothetical protein